jgi:hypothetical protein
MWVIPALYPTKPSKVGESDFVSGQLLTLPFGRVERPLGK